MALKPETVTAITHRHGLENIKRLTRRATYKEDGDEVDTFDSVDEDVLETAVRQSQEQVRQRIGPVEEDHWGVIELIPYFLGPPGDNLDELAFNRILERLVAEPAGSASTAKGKGADGQRRRYDGDHFTEDADVQAPGRPRRSTF